MFEVVLCQAFVPGEISYSVLLTNYVTVFENNSVQFVNDIC